MAGMKHGWDRPVCGTEPSVTFRVSGLPMMKNPGYIYVRTSSKRVISGGAPKRMGTPMVPMPRLT